MGWLQRLTDGLAKTRDAVRDSVDRLLARGPDPDAVEELEAALLAADLGPRTVTRCLERMKASMRSGGRGQDLKEVLRATILETLAPSQAAAIGDLVARGPRPFVILAVGVNGVGKTTTVAKLASRLHEAGLKPLLVAADTFRAAATEQLQTWGARLGIDVIHHRHGADPSAVVFDGATAAKARGVDVVLVDTAGRLHTKSNLMDELKKMRRVLEREIPGAPHEVLLVLDATVGQNALSQARQFREAAGVTGLALTKLDGTARGGIVVAISEELGLPVRLIGVGEAAEDLQEFRPRDFVDALFTRT
jgi:fused signal recognition particle receptor